MYIFFQKAIILSKGAFMITLTSYIRPRKIFNFPCNKVPLKILLPILFWQKTNMYLYKIRSLQQLTA